MITQFPILYKANKGGTILTWSIHVEEESQNDPFPPCGRIVTFFGQRDGLIQRAEDLVTEGKNPGKKNETNAFIQAVKEARARWEKQIKKGYVEDLEKAQRREDDIGGVLPMLAHKFSEHEAKISYPVLVQRKYDGTRCIAIVKEGKASLFSRTRKPITSMEHIANELVERFPTGNYVFDGELFHLKVNDSQRPFLEIKNPKGIILIDREDHEKLNGYSMSILMNGYATICPGSKTERKKQYVHRLIMGNPPRPAHVDHINGNKLDNRKANLRIVTCSQNVANSGKRVTNTSGFKGVMFFVRDRNWHAQITVDYKKIHLGYFSTPEKAAIAYDSAAIKYFGNSAQLNFPSKNAVGSFETLISAVRVEKPTNASREVQYFIYDMVSPEPFINRNASINSLFSSHPSTQIVVVPSYWAESKEAMLTLYSTFVEEGYEGAIVRNAHSPYSHSRSYDLQKVKTFQDAEFQIVGVEEGRGKLVGHAIFKCITPPPEGNIFQVKLKGDLAKLKELFENPKLWQGKFLTVQFQGYSNKNRVPRFPVGLRIRENE